MYSKTRIRSSSKHNNNNKQKQYNNHHSNNNNIFKNILKTLFQIINLLEGPLPLIYCLLSMSLFYQVVGAVKCPKIKKHAGIKLRPINKASKEPYMPNDLILYTCESTEHTQTIRCLDDGRWNEEPYCPDPVNNTCPDLGPLPHGAHNSSGPPYKVGTVLAFRCENEYPPPPPPLSSVPITTVSAAPPATTTTTTLLSSGASNSHLEPSSLISAHTYQNVSSLYLDTTSEQQQQEQAGSLRYNLTGHRLLKCLPSSKWNHPMPSCTPLLPEPTSQFAFVLASVMLVLIPILIIATVFHLFMKWRKRQQQRERWKQYFTDYKYRHSKTSIAFGNRPNASTANNNNHSNTTATTIPVTDL